MAKTKRATSRAKKQPAKTAVAAEVEHDSPELPQTPEAITRLWLSEIRQQLLREIAPFIDGPFKKPPDNRFWIKDCDGTPHWYREKSGLPEKGKLSRKKFDLLKMSLRELDYIEGEVEAFRDDRCYLPRLFGCSLRLGQYTQLAKTHISTDNHHLGAPKKLSNDEIIKVRLARAKGHSVPTILKAINASRPEKKQVKKDTIYRALQSKGVSQK